jgi:hypothetical protein
MVAIERDAAMRQLDAALDEQARLSEDWLAEIGTPNEIVAYARLRVMSEEIAALRGSLAQDEGSVAVATASETHTLGLPPGLPLPLVREFLGGVDRHLPDQTRTTLALLLTELVSKRRSPRRAARRA